MSLKTTPKERSTRSKKREVLQRIGKDYKDLYLKMNLHYTKNNWGALTPEEIVLFDSGNYPDTERQKEYSKGKGYYTKLMALKAKYLELTSIINVGVDENGNLTFEPGKNYKPEIIIADQRPATALEISEANKPDQGLVAMKQLVTRVAPNLKRV